MSVLDQLDNSLPASMAAVMKERTTCAHPRAEANPAGYRHECDKAWKLRRLGLGEVG
jgi:hypothetical protein